jgi:membrane-associated protease RseP (regulator of RpoE activity)
VGHPTNESDVTTVIGYMPAESPAAKAGLLPGDKIIEVDGERVTRFGGMNNSVVWNVVRSEGDTIPIKVERNGRCGFPSQPYKAETSGWRRKSVRQVLIMPAQTPIVDKVIPGFSLRRRPVCAWRRDPWASMRADLQPGRGGEHIEKNPDQPIKLQVMRDGSCSSRRSSPRLVSADEKKPALGIRGMRGTCRSRTRARSTGLQQRHKHAEHDRAVASPKSDVKLQHLSRPGGIGRSTTCSSKANAAGSWRSGSA